MKPKDEYIHTLTAQLKEWSAQIAILSAREEKAATEARKYAQELDELHAKLRDASEKLKELEGPGSDVWENIGDGG